MSSEDVPPSRALRGFALGGALVIAALGGAFITRTLSPSQHPAAERQARPIVQIVRQQPGLPDLADIIDRLCPSVAMIRPHGANVRTASSSAPPVAASIFSADGWLVTYAADLPKTGIEAVFGDGRVADLSDLRVDPVSGLAIVKAANAAAAPLAFSDQPYPRIGQFGFVLTTFAGTGCSADSAMIGSDFLADGGGPLGYVRLQPPPDGWHGGVPLLGADGSVLGIGADDPAGAVIPAPVASAILDELIRNSLSATTSFGFRAIDFVAPFATRLGDVRSGAGVALVQPRSSAARAGLRAGDIVTAVNDVPISSASELSRTLDGLSSKAVLTIQRHSQEVSFAIYRASS